MIRTHSCKIFFFDCTSSMIAGYVYKTMQFLKILNSLHVKVLNNEEFPMYARDARVFMMYPPGIPEDSRFALGHPFFGLLPGLFLYQTIWMREHNRVCDILREEHPDWDDERLFQTGKLITLG